MSSGTNDGAAAAGQARAIDEGKFVEINGVDQWVTIRGSDLGNPVLLLLHGPGFALSPMARFFAPWERDFTLVQWDQPGAGATYAKNGAAATVPLTVDGITRDGIAVTELVRRRLQADRVVVLGTSGGTLIGLQMVKARPDLFSAYVGNGQVVDWARQEALCYAMVLARARAAGDEQAVAELVRIGPPPYQDVASVAVKGKYANAMTPAEQAVFADPAVRAAMSAPPADAAYVARGLPPFDARALSMATFDRLRGEIEAFDARRLGLDFDVPMFFFQGEHDAHTVTSEVQAYEAEIRAPKKMIVLIEGGGHASLFLRDELLSLLTRHVRPVAARADAR